MTTRYAERIDYLIGCLNGGLKIEDAKAKELLDVLARDTFLFQMNTKFLGRVPVGKCLQYIASSDVAVCLAPDAKLSMMSPLLIEQINNTIGELIDKDFVLRDDELQRS